MQVAIKTYILLPAVNRGLNATCLLFSGALWVFWTIHFARVLHRKKHVSDPLSHEATAANKCKRLVPQSQRERTLPVLRPLSVFWNHQPLVRRRLPVHSHPLLRPGHESGHPHRESRFPWTVNNWSQVNELKPQKKKSEIKIADVVFQGDSRVSIFEMAAEAPYFLDCSPFSSQEPHKVGKKNPPMSSL